MLLAPNLLQGPCNKVIFKALLLPLLETFVFTLLMIMLFHLQVSHVFLSYAMLRLCQFKLNSDHVLTVISVRLNTVDIHIMQ